ncbi:Hypothetical protein R9X50_00507500 [Acrodontium crateriforme]|uniref:Formin GTPase-binding domain-containing protein n=1 Tax=Acrodontium crateriforme TaxID=150365 RepID=A0AAQ3R8V7_9PEZI|nr:Hypothetical protein R9X50_00507500 [Acrodontium crateriforme]
MDTGTAQSRQQHRRHPSSRANIFKSLVSSKSRPPSPDRASESNPLGERQSNVQSPPSSPSKNDTKTTRADSQVYSQPLSYSRESALKKSKSSSNITSIFTKKNRSSKELSHTVQKDKENSTPPTSSHEVAVAPIWAQLTTSPTSFNHPESNNSRFLDSVQDEIARYTPQEYSPSKQRNFNGDFDQPGLRPRLTGRPQSTQYEKSESTTELERRTSGNQTTSGGRFSEDNGRRLGRDQIEELQSNKYIRELSNTNRKTSDGSTEQAPLKEKLTIAKRGGRVMAAVAAFQSKSKTEHIKVESPLDPKDIDVAFEKVLISRNVPEPMREKMRSLTLRVKTDFIKQDQGSKTTEGSPLGSINSETGKKQDMANVINSPESNSFEDDGKSTKRSRSRSRTFTFSKADKHGEASPSKKARSRSKNRSISTQNLTEASISRSFGRTAAAAIPADYIAYLKNNPDPTQAEVGRLHKLRILLRNETVTWVDNFVSLGGMSEIVSLLHRIMAIEWREEHEDQLLHETLLCLKGLCTTERAMLELEKVADELFPALLGMLFGDEKKGPAEYSTRTVILNVLFNHLAAAMVLTSAEIEKRARKILAYLGDPKKSVDSRPVDFVLNMHISRPFKLWSREVSNVTKEVFWIFLHHLNVVPLPKLYETQEACNGDPLADSIQRARSLAATYTTRHFPGARPPVPAAPYIGGVEWDATTYLTAHLDLLNGLIASIPSSESRNELREQMQASGFEKILGSTLRTCKEKFYSGVHDGLRSWVAASNEDGWDTLYVREGPTLEEQAERAKSCSPKKSPTKKMEPAPRLDLNLGLTETKNNDDDGWLG